MKQRSEEVLKVGLSFAKGHYMMGTIVFSIVSIFIAYLVYQNTSDPRAYYWLCAMLLTSATCIGVFWYRKQHIKQHSLETPWARESFVQVLLLLPQSITYSWLPAMFILDSPIIIAVTLTMITVGLAAGAVALVSPFLTGFFCLTYPAMLTVAACLYLREESILNWLTLATLLLLAGLTWFAARMASTIHGSIELAQHNTALITKLRAALIQTDEANRAKSVFLASASHDLRQPLHALGLLVETLGGTKMTAQQDEIQNHMMSAVDSTRGMLDSLLNISKLDAGAITADPRPFLVNSLFRKLEDELAPTADEHELIYRSRDTIVAVHSDPFIVELILRNLVANAIRYTDRGGLLVACRRAGKDPEGQDMVAIEVWDTGIGIAIDQTDEIFSEFQQLDNPERDAQKGFGLGLAIAQGLAKTIGSQITVKSRVGSGSAFRFELPLSEAQVIEDMPSKAAAAVDFSGRSVLIIDDDSRVRASMRSLMLSWGCECIDGESAKQAIDSIGEQQIDILLVDYRLREGRTGREAIEDVRTFLGRQVPAIIITGDTGTERIQEAQAVDALLLHKPASTSQLQRMMRSLLS